MPSDFGANVHRGDQGRDVKLAQEWRLPDGVPVVMLPGRLTRWKGQTVLIDALAKLGRKDICALIVGSDQGRVAYREELVHRAERAGLGSTVRLLPDCRDMPAAYMLADVVVSASTDPEAFGRVAAEEGLDQIVDQARQAFVEFAERHVFGIAVGLQVQDVGDHARTQQHVEERCGLVIVGCVAFIDCHRLAPRG